jgi:hypothetical protein
MLSRGNCWLSVEGIPEPIPTDDNRLWVPEFRSRQSEADHSVIAELHSA